MENKLKHFNNLAMFWPRFIRAGSGPEARGTTPNPGGTVQKTSVFRIAVDVQQTDICCTPTALRPSPGFPSNLLLVASCYQESARCRHGCAISHDLVRFGDHVAHTFFRSWGRGAEAQQRPDSGGPAASCTGRIAFFNAAGTESTKTEAGDQLCQI